MDGKGGNDTLIGGPGDDIYKVYATGTTTIIENPDKVSTRSKPMRLSNCRTTSKTFS